MNSKNILTLIPLIAIAIIVPLLLPSGIDSSRIIEKLDSIYIVERTIEYTDAQSAISSSNTPTRIRKLLRLDLNSATREELMGVYGIGEVFSRRIVEYRELLGGYHSVEQLREVKGIDAVNYEKIFRNFYIEIGSYSKISINFATLNELKLHPYFTNSMVKRIDKARKRGGYFTNYQEIIESDILLPDEAQRVAPYLLF